MTYIGKGARAEAERDIARWSIGDESAWLVVDTGSIDKPQYRAWREKTVAEIRCRDWLPDYELISRAENGKLFQIA